MKNLNAYLVYAAVISSLLLLISPLQATTCANAIPITTLPVINQALVCGTNNDLSTTTVPDECNNFQNDYKEGKEALYRFTPSASGSYFISCSGKPYTSIFVYNGCPNAGGSCVAGLGSVPQYKTLSVSLTAGITYYIWFDIWAAGGESACPGTFSITPSVPNDNCSGAITFPPFLFGSTAVTVSTSGATGTLDSTCEGTENDDVWYSFTTPAGVTSLAYVNGNVVGGNGNFVLQVFQGTCGNLTSIGCYDPERGVINGLSGNTTYYLRAYTYASSGGNSTFDLVLILPPAHDNCSGALAFPTIQTDGSCSQLFISTENTSGTLDATCIGTEDDDVWYSFTTPPAITFVSYSTTNFSGNADRVFQLFSGDCNGLTSIGCYDPEVGTITGLSPNTTYYLRVFTKSSGAVSSFYLCLSALPPSNDNCSNAIAFPPIQATCSEVVVVNTTVATGTGDVACTGEADDDLWYTFTTPSGYTFVNYGIANISGNTNRVLEVFSGDCSGLTSIGCYDPEVGSITGLSPNTTYYLRVFTKGSGVISTFSICLSVQSPPNDFCSGAFAFPALPTDGSCATVLVSTENATGTNDPTCSGNEDDDVWYTFTTPPGVTRVLYNTTYISGSSDARALQLLEGTCDGLISISCHNFLNTSGIFDGLSGNTTYYLRGYSYPASLYPETPIFSNFEICLRVPPSNDNCTGAISFPPIPLDYDCASVTATTVSATSSGSTNCAGSQDDDVWFTFTTPSNVSKLLYRNTNISGAIDRILQVYQGACTGLVAIGCYNEESGAITGLSGNTTYYLRAYTYNSGVNSTFNICLHVPLPNDECSQPIAFPVIPNDGSCATVSANTFNATGPSSSTCPGIPDDDVWFSFSVPNGTTALEYHIANLSGDEDHVINLFRGNCNTPVGCFDTENGTFSGLIANTTYYIRVFTKQAGVASIFDICLNTVPGLANDFCTGAISIPGIPLDGSFITTNISTFSATGSSSTTCMGEEDDDVWYTFTTPPGYTSVFYGMTNISGSTDRVLQVFKGTCPSALTSVGCYDQESGSITGLTGNTTYYLRAYTYSASVVSEFNLYLGVAPRPSNNECAGAIFFPEIPMDGSCASVTVTTAGATGVTSSTCTGAEDDDVWYGFSTPSGVTSVIYDFTNISGNTDRACEVFQGTCGGLVSIGCYNLVPGGFISGLSGNTTYFLRIYTKPSGVSSTFQLCLRFSPPPPNDDCSAATVFPDIPSDGSGSTVSFTIFGATGTPDNNCLGVEDDDVWLKFTVPQGVTTLLYNYTHIAGNDESYFQLYSGDCENLTLVGCHYALSKGFIKDLNSNSTYYMRVYTQFSNVAGAFQLTLKAASTNDECSGATPFPDFPSTENCAQVFISTFNATPSTLANGLPCSSGTVNDLWYSFSLPAGITHILYEKDYFPTGNQWFQILSGDCSGLTSLGCYNNIEGVITGLSSGVVYYIRAYSTSTGGTGEFNLCLRLPLPNDECSGAIAFPAIPDDGSCVTLSASTVHAMGASDPTCSGAEDDDIWYTFTTPPGVTSLAYSISNLASSNDIYCQLFSGNNCSTLTSIGCYDSHNVLFTGLTGNTTYYLRVYSNFGDSNNSSIFDICLRLPLVNDECSGAIAFPDLTTDGNCSSVTASTALAHGFLYEPTCYGQEDDEVWFSFTTPPNTNIAYYEVTTTSGDPDLILQLFSGDCGNLTFMQCHDPEIGVISGLNGGTTYYLKVYTKHYSVNATFSICLQAGVISDICDGAIAFPDIPLDGSCAMVTVSTVHATTTPGFVCVGEESADVWFTFTTPPGVSILAYENLSLSNTENQVLQLFSGECSNLTSIGCYDPETGIISGLSGSTTYYLRARKRYAPGAFNICLRTLALNDECSGAIAFPDIPLDGSCSTLQLSTKFATGTPDPTCLGTEDDDVWYSFTTPSGVTKLAYLGAYNLYFQVFSGSCNSLTSIGCFQSTQGTISGLAGNTTYYLRVYNVHQEVYQTASFCLQLTPVNDACSEAIVFPSIPLDGSCATVSCYTSGATASGSPACEDLEYRDVWYAFTTPPNTTSLWYEITNVSLAGSRALEVLGGSCNNLISIGCYDPDQGIISGLSGNTTYYIRAYTPSSISVFDICLRLPPANDNCPNAIAFPDLPIDGDCSSMNVSTFYASPSGVPICMEGGFDVWYTFTTPPNTAAVWYEISGLPSNQAPVLQVLSGSCGNLVSTGCYNSNSGVFTNLVGNTTYYLRAHTASLYSTNVTFGLCLRRTAANDLCQAAIAFPPIPADGSFSKVIARTQRATGSNDPTCTGVEDDDIWFTFTTPPNVTRLLYENGYISGGNPENFQILSGSCGNLTSVGCYPGSSGLVTGLSGNTTYYIRAYSEASGNSSVWSIGLRLPLVNDNCANATPVGSCNATINGSFYGATGNAPDNDCVGNINSNTPGLWYRMIGDGLPVILYTCKPNNFSDAGIAVYSGSCGSLVCVTGNEGACYYGSQVSWTTVAGEEYYIFLYQFDDGGSNFTLSVVGGEQCPSAIGQTTVSIDTMNTGATISWPAIAGIENYEYILSTTGSCSTGAVQTTSGNLASFPGLEPNTQYTFCLRSNCSCYETGFASLSFTTPPCEEPLGTPWTVTDIGGASGTAINNYCGGTIDMSSDGVSASSASDVRLFAFQNFCDSVAITAKVNHTTTGDFAGIILRESTAAGARMISLKSKGTKYVYLEIRSIANGTKNTQQFLTLNHKWLRMVRNGNQIIGYSSGNGVHWQQHFSVSLAMPSCIDAGLFAESTELGAPAMGAFSNVSIVPSTLTIVLPNGEFPTEENPTEGGGDYFVYPNPTESAINVKMGEAFIDKELTITIINQLGQMVAIRKIREVQDPIETFDVRHLPPGVYIITLRTEGGGTLAKKFVVGASAGAIKY